MPSGSGATAPYSSQWPYFKSLLFLEPYVQHRESVSSNKFSDTFDKMEKTKFIRQKNKTNKDNNVDRILKKALDNVSVVPDKNTVYEKYLKLIKR